MTVATEVAVRLKTAAEHRPIVASQAGIDVVTDAEGQVPDPPPYRSPPLSFASSSERVGALQIMAGGLWQAKLSTWAPFSVGPLAEQWTTLPLRELGDGMARLELDPAQLHPSVATAFAEIEALLGPGYGGLAYHPGLLFRLSTEDHSTPRLRDYLNSLASNPPTPGEVLEGYNAALVRRSGSSGGTYVRGLALRSEDAAGVLAMPMLSNGARAGISDRAALERILTAGLDAVIDAHESGEAAALAKTPFMSVSGDADVAAWVAGKNAAPGTLVHVFLVQAEPVNTLYCDGLESLVFGPLAVRSLRSTLEPKDVPVYRGPHGY